MTVQELIDLLSEKDPDSDVIIPCPTGGDMMIMDIREVLIDTDDWDNDDYYIYIS
jgi:hypothetical protein